MNDYNANSSGFGQGSGFPPGGGYPPPGGGYPPPGGMPPENQMPQLPDEPELKITNTGSRIAAIVIVSLLVIAGIAVLVMMNNKKKEIQKYEDVRAAFQKAHTAGYVDFWKQVQVDVKGMKSNEEFEAKMRTVTTDQVRYARHIKEQGIPVIDKALPEYKAVAAPPDLTAKVVQVTTALEELRAAWDGFASEYAKFADYFRANEKLESASGHWLGFQQDPSSEKFMESAVKYFKVLQCIFKDQKINELDFENMESEVAATCAAASAKPEWFRHVAFECLTILNGTDGVPDDAFNAAVKAAAPANDTTSKFGIDTCLKKSKEDFEAEEFGKLAVPWMTYIKAQNELLKAIDEKIKSLN